MTVLINKQIIRRLNGLYESFNNITNKLTEIKKQKNGLTVALSNFVERSIKNQSLLKEGVSNTNHTNNDSNVLNFNNSSSKTKQHSKSQIFSLSRKLENNFFSDEEIFMSDEDSETSEDYEKLGSKNNIFYDENNTNKSKNSNSPGSPEKENFKKYENFERYQDHQYKDKNILVNNINNINNIHITNVNDLEILNRMKKLNYNKNNARNNNNSIKLNPGLPPMYNFDDNSEDLKNNNKNDNKNNSEKKSTRKGSDDNFSKKSDIKSQKSLKKTISKNNKYVIEIFDDFEIYSAKVIKNKEFADELMESGIDAEKCLIISNREGFLGYFNKLKIALHDIIVDIDPVEAKKWKKRKGYNLGFNENKDIKKEDFFNSTPNLNQEKGMIHFGNKNIELVLTMMMGIRKSINSLGENPNLYKFKEKDEAFKDFNCFNFIQANFESEYVSKK